MPLKQKPDADRLFRELAGRYAELEGHALRQELGAGLHRCSRPNWTGGSAAPPAADPSGASPGPLLRRGLPAGGAGPARRFSKPGPVSPRPFRPCRRIPLASLSPLPARLVLMSAEQDEAKTICYLKDSLADDVILVMEPAEGPPAGDGLAEGGLGGQTVYTRQTPDYQLLLLQKDGIGYTLTCRYELDHLLAIGKEILK